MVSMYSMYYLFRTRLKINTCSDASVANCYLSFAEEVATKMSEQVLFLASVQQVIHRFYYCTSVNDILLIAQYW